MARRENSDKVSEKSETHQDRFLQRHPNAKELFGLFEYLPGAYFFAKDAAHRYVGANQLVLKEVFGLDALEDLLGKTDLDFQPPVLAEAYHAEDRRVMDWGVAVPNEIWLVPHVQGAPKWYVSSKTPLRDESGVVIGLAGVMYRLDNSKDRAVYFKDLAPVIDRIEKGYTEDLSMRELAKSVPLSPTQFNLRFRQILRMSPSEYLQKMRVEAAQGLLVRSEKSIAEIGAEVGYYDQSHFTKCFKKVTGMTPRPYRLRFR